FLAEIEGRHRDERGHQRLHRIESAILGNEGADLIEPAVDALLRANARRLAGIARPALHRVAPRQPDIERTADVALRSLGKGREFLHLGQCRRAAGGPSPRPHDPTLLLPEVPDTPRRLKKPLTKSPTPVQEVNHASIPAATAN